MTAVHRRCRLQLDNGVKGKWGAVDLMREERAAVLGVLDDPPEGLAELRGVLMREQRR